MLGQSPGGNSHGTGIRGPDLAKCYGPFQSVISVTKHDDTRSYPRLWLLITLAVAVLSLCSIAATVALLASTVTREYQAAINKTLSQKAGRRIDQLDYVVQEIQRDVEFLRNTPPIQGLIRSRNNNGVDPVDGLRVDQWKESLAAIFRAVLIAKSEYVQVRFIGLADAGRELVRVDKNPDTGLIGEPVELQQKLTRPYVRDAFLGAKDRVYLSDIDLNREFGVIQTPHLPVIRASLPVYDEITRKPFGVVVINLAASLLFEALTSHATEDQQLLLANEDEEYLIAPPGKEAFAFEFGRSSNVRTDFPELSKQLITGGHIKDFDEATNTYIYARSLLTATNAPPLRIILLHRDTQTHRIVADILRKSMLAILVVLLISVLSGFLLSRLFARPLRQLASRYGEDYDEKVAPLTQGLIYEEAAELNRVLTDSFTELRHLNLQLAASNAELDQFAYIASHDLKEPVRSIQTMAEMVISDADSSLSPDSQQAAEFLRSAATRMSQLIDGLLEYSRIGSEREAALVDLNEVFENIQEDLGDKIRETQAHIEVPNNLPTLRLYELETRLMFQNLIANSLKFCPLERHPHIQVAATQIADCSWKISISDNGIGIPLSQWEKIFLIFRRATTRSEYAGSGIGLAHCRKIAELHNGDIWVDASSKEGTTMCVMLNEVETNEA